MDTCACGNPASLNGTTCRRCDALHELGLKAGATDAEVKAAHRLYVKAWHPDRFPGDEKSKNAAQEKLKSINSAYEFLSSPSSKNGQPYRPKANRRKPQKRSLRRPDAAARSLLRSQTLGVVRPRQGLLTQGHHRPQPDLNIRRSPASHTPPSDWAGPFRRVSSHG